MSSGMDVTAFTLVDAQTLGTTATFLWANFMLFTGLCASTNPRAVFSLG